MNKKDVKPGEQLTLAQIHRIRKQQRAGESNRAQLVKELDSLPGDYTDADYVVNGMRRHFGDVFTEADEVRVRECVGSGGGAKPSDGLKVEELRAALEAKGIEIPADAKKADLAELLDNAA